MNHTVVKVFSYAMLALGVFALFGGFASNPMDGAALIGGLLFGAQACITLWYANRASIEDHKAELAAAVAAELNK